VACQRLASLSRPPRDPQDVYERIFTTSLEEDYDCGRLSTATFVERLRRDLQLEASDEAIVRAWCDIFTPNPDIEEVIVREKRAVRDSCWRATPTSCTSSGSAGSSTIAATMSPRDVRWHAGVRLRSGAAAAGILTTRLFVSSRRSQQPWL